MNFPLLKTARSFFVLGVIITSFASNTSAQTEKKLDSLFKSLAGDGDFNGTVIVADQGKPIYEKAFGYANFDTKQPLENQTMFELASVSKQFTAMAIMQLHQRGKLNYNDAVVKYLPELPYKTISIGNLLHHTSGIPEFLAWSAQYIDVNRINYNQDILNALVKNKIPLDFTPGDKLVYCNTNYVLLALIVEKVSGKSFSEFLNETIFEPLNMTHTRVYPQRAAKQKIANYAYGYLFNPEKNAFDLNDNMISNKFEYYFDGVAGPYGISSNTEDMLKWDQALYSEKLVSHAVQDEAYMSAKLNDGKDATFNNTPYGFGWQIMSNRPGIGRRYMHSGGYPGYMSIIYRYPDKNKTIILLTNIYNVISLYQLAASIENILVDKPFKIPEALPFKKSLTLTPMQLKAIEGTYIPALAPQMTFTISAENSQIYAQLTGQRKIAIYADSELNFFYTVVAAKIKFTKDDEGKVKSLTLVQNGRELVAEKQ